MISLESIDAEIQQLEADLRNAEHARISDADRRAQEIRQQLENKRQALEAAQELESRVVAEQERQRQLESLREVESQVQKAGNLVVALKAELSQLPARLALAQYEHRRLCRVHAQLKQEIQS